jgi:putative peptidoglycan lipid II flippase
MLKYAIPISLANIIGSFMLQFYFFILPWFVDNSIIGNYGLSNNFVVLISFFSLPITTMLFPAFSKLDVKRDSETLKNIFQYSVKYASLLVVPVAALVMCLSGPAVATLFGNKYSLAPLFLALSSISYLFTAAGNLSTGNILVSQGQTNLNLKITLLTVVIGFPLGYLLIMLFGVAGLIISSAVAGIPGLLFSLVWVKRNYGLTVDWLSSTKILASSAIAAVLTYLFVGVISFSSLVELLLGVLVYAVVLIGAILFTRALSLTDLKSLRDMTGGLGSLSKIFNAVLDILEKVMVKLKLANY